MNVEMRTYVVNLLDTCHERTKRIALLRYELEHPSRISPDELIGMMSLGHGDNAIRSKGPISNKTMYIALNYQERMERLNTDTADEIAAQLMELEQEQNKLRYYVSLLDTREADVIRLVYFEGRTWNEAAKELDVTTRTVHRVKERAITKLAEMYDFTGETF